MQNKKTITLGELIPAAGLVCLIIAVAAVGASLIGNQTIRQRQSEGEVVSATVSNKRQEWVSNGRTNIRANAITVMFFDETITTYETVELAEGIEIEMPSNIEFGDFHSADIVRVSDEVFDDISNGESIDIIYLPSDPEQAWVLADVEDVRPWNGLPFIIGTTLLGGILVGSAFIKKKKS